MTPPDLPPVGDPPHPTQHGLLVCWGQFAHELGLLDHRQRVPIPQKTVTHTPAAKLLTLFLGLLSGIEYLSDRTHGPSPLHCAWLPGPLSSYRHPVDRLRGHG